VRYRDTGETLQQAGDPTLPLTGDFVALTVWMTLFIGILFTIVGVRASQRWLVFWGIATVVACGWYGLFLT